MYVEVINRGGSGGDRERENLLDHLKKIVTLALFKFVVVLLFVNWKFGSKIVGGHECHKWGT